MNVHIFPGKLQGNIVAPPSKSMAHRMLICAGLCAGQSCRIDGISGSDDVSATLHCLQAMGASYRKEGESVYITGSDIKSLSHNIVLDCHESGSTLRFLIPLCLLNGARSTVTLTGSAKLLSRPLGVYETICKNQNITYLPRETDLSVCGQLSSGEYRIPGNISSQFISGLLFALPLCDGDSVIDIMPPIESRSYLDLTIEALSLFGVTVNWKDERTLIIKGGQRYHAPESTSVEGDYSNAAFFAALSVLGNDVTVSGLSENSHQGDKAYIRYFEMLNKGTPTIHIGDCPDLGPILMAVACAKNGAVFTGTKRLKIKESDRGNAMATELSKFGVSVKVHEDSIVVYPLQFHAPTEPLCGHNDHRIVMSLATLLTRTGGDILGAEAVKKSLPEYFIMLQSLGAEVTTYETH